MPRQAASPSLLLILLAAVAGTFGVGATGCGHHVGDTCHLNSDCSPLGDRFCDASQTNGYCTLEGCDVRMSTDGTIVDSCPSEAVCVRFFEQIASASKLCDIPTASFAMTAAPDCSSDEICLCDCADPARPGLCLPRDQCPDVITPKSDPDHTKDRSKPGHCAPVSSERRWCQLTCGKVGDICRNDGYVCRATGSNGAEPVARTIQKYMGVLANGGVQYAPVFDGSVRLPDGGTTYPLPMPDGGLPGNFVPGPLTIPVGVAATFCVHQ